MELSKKIEELLEKYDFSLCGDVAERYSEKGKYDVELETYSPEGENVIVSLVYDGTEDGFITAFVEYANWFDAEDHAEMWIESRGKNGVPESIKDLLEDAEWIKNTLLEVAEELNNIDDESEKTDSMNREQFYNYILENFTISGEAGRLIDNILQYVEANFPEENEQYNVLCSLFDGTIGLTDNELKKVYM
ncbi:MAG: hypothetical protein NC416_01165 [Eubacterium sp.]|nr:hypothetical protein [Eubacterium sp.]